MVSIPEEPQRGYANMDCSRIPTNKNFNPEIQITWVNGEPTQIDKVWFGVTYRRTLTFTNGELTNVSPWMEV